MVLVFYKFTIVVFKLCGTYLGFFIKMIVYLFVANCGIVFVVFFFFSVSFFSLFRVLDFAGLFVVWEACV